MEEMTIKMEYKTDPEDVFKEIKNNKIISRLDFKQKSDHRYEARCNDMKITLYQYRIDGTWQAEIDDGFHHCKNTKSNISLKETLYNLEDTIVLYYKKLLEKERQLWLIIKEK